MPRRTRTTRPDIDSQTQVINLDRALTILETLADGPTMGVTELATALDMPKNTVFRITNTLHARGYIMRDKSKQYSLSSRLLALGYAAVFEGHLVEKSMDVMRTLRDQTNETVLVGMLSGLEGVVLEEVPSDQKVKVVVGIGERFPLHTAAPGKAIMAGLPEDELNALLDRLEMTRFTERTITTKRDMLDHLAAVSEQGYAVDDCEEAEGLRCVGSAVLDLRGYPIGAIWTTGPAFRFPASLFQKFGPLVVDAARQISHRFGWRG